MFDYILDDHGIKAPIRKRVRVAVQVMDHRGVPGWDEFDVDLIGERFFPQPKFN